MGGIRFVQQEPQRYEKTLVEAHFINEDGIPVSIALNANEQKDLLELDFWKVDFMLFRHYLSPSEVIVEPLHAVGLRQPA